MLKHKKDIKIYNEFHLGDHLYNIHLFRKILNIKKNIRILYSCNNIYFKSINPFLKDYENKIILTNNFKNGINAWIGCYPKIYPPDEGYYDLMYFKFYKILCDQIGCKSPILKEEDVFFDNIELLENNELSNKVDLLIGNNKCYSRQWNGDYSEFDKLINIYKNIFRIVTTAPNNCNLPCTLDYNYNLLQIGNIAINSKIIIGTHSAPYCTFINKYNYQKNHFYVCQNIGINYKFATNSINIKNIQEMKNIKINKK